MASKRGNRAASAGQERPRRRPVAVISRIIGGVLIVIGLTIGAGVLFAPEATERIYGDAKIGVQELGRDVAAVAEETVTGEKTYPQINLGVSGTVRELDRCDGTFTEMKSYERDGVPPVWAAHNNCGGDIILPWEIGTELQITGNPTVYRVVDIRYTSKVWSSTADLVGLSGELALQTCFYGEDRMKFIGLEPVA